MEFTERPQGKRKIFAAYLPRGENRFLKLTIQHRDGGHNPFCNTNEARGTELMLTMVTRSIESGVTFESMDLGAPTNARIHLETRARYSENSLRAAAAALEPLIATIGELWPDDKQGVLRLTQRVFAPAA